MLPLSPPLHDVCTGESARESTVMQQFTTMVIDVEDPHVDDVKVIVLFPIFAAEGVKTPVTGFTPGPDHVPPAFA